ncbi:thermonuclease family protein [Oligoflexia bacterium]|nr:thermonuclease family protein [Oligoflexia bacterium]
MPRKSPFDLDPMPEIKFHREAILRRVVDGDTLDVEIDLGWSMKLKERLRLEFVDTPELNKKEEKKAGQLVKSHLEELLPVDTTRLIITSMAYDRNGRVRGKYGRTMAVVYRADDGWCLNKYLLKERLAWKTDENGKIAGKRDLSLLTGIAKLNPPL